MQPKNKVVSFRKRLYYYAWVILLASFLCLGLGEGFRQIFGILYIEILDVYEAGKYVTSWIIALQTVCWGLVGESLKILLFLKKNVGRHMSFDGAADTPGLDFWQSRGVRSLRLTSGATPAYLLTASMFPTCVF